MITPHLIATAYGRPWNMSPIEWYARIHSPIIAAIKNGETSQGPSQTEQPPLAKRPLTDFRGNPIQQMEIREGVATIPIKGVLVSGATPYEKRAFDFCDYGDVHEDLDAAIAAKAKQIVLDVDSPGGSVLGCAELANRVAELLASGVNIEARTGGLMCSAAYYVSSGARVIRATSTAWVGSIGTIWETINIADLLSELGVEWNVFTSGPLKGTGHPAKKLSDAQREFMQGMVDSMAGDFKAHVRANRPRVKEESMQGQPMTGKQGLEAGLVSTLLSR